jgi:hypothetical protein
MKLCTMKPCCGWYTLEGESTISYSQWTPITCLAISMHCFWWGVYVSTGSLRVVHPGHRYSRRNWYKITVAYVIHMLHTWHVICCIHVAYIAHILGYNLIESEGKVKRTPPSPYGAKVRGHSINYIVIFFIINHICSLAALLVMCKLWKLLHKL